jgi:hypothetical protein
MEELTGEDISGLPESGKDEKAEKKKAGKDEKAEKKKAGKDETLIERLKAKQYDSDRRIKQLEEQLEAAKEEKRKPGISVINAEGDREKKKRINSSGLSDKVLPPYTKNQIATYRIISADEINPATGQRVMPVDVSIPGEYLFHDLFDMDVLKRDKIRRNVIGTKTVIVDGKPQVQEQVEDVEFNRGWLHVPCATKYALYVFIELHPLYKGNRFRPNNAPVVFERTDLRYNSPAAKAAALELSLDAGQIVRGMRKDEVMNYALGSNPPIPTAGREVHEIRTDLLTRVIANPIPFFKQNKNEKAGILINVSDAIAFGLVEYQQDRKSFVLVDTDEVLFTHTVTEEPTSAFVKHLSKDGNAPYYDAILDRLNYWGND